MTSLSIVSYYLFFKIMSQYLSITPHSISKKSIEQVCRTPLGMFAEYPYVPLEKKFIQVNLFK